MISRCSVPLWLWHSVFLAIKGIFLLGPRTCPWLFSISGAVGLHSSSLPCFAQWGKDPHTFPLSPAVGTDGRQIPSGAQDFIPNPGVLCQNLRCFLAPFSQLRNDDGLGREEGLLQDQVDTEHQCWAHTGASGPL